MASADCCKVGRFTLSMREGYRQFRVTEMEIAEIKKRDQYFYGRYRYEPTGKLELSVEFRLELTHLSIND